MAYDRGTLMKGPDLLADHDFRPYVCLSDDAHPFNDEEALYAAITTTRRAVAMIHDGGFDISNVRKIR